MKRLLLILGLGVWMGLAAGHDAVRADGGTEQASSPLPAATAPETAPEAVAERPVSEADSAEAQRRHEQGRRLYFQGRFEQAIEVLQAAVAADPTRSAYRLLLARALRRAGHDDRAVEMLEVILEANPEHVEAGLELAELLDPEAEPERVIAVLEPLLPYKTDFPLYYMLAVAWSQRAAVADEPVEAPKARQKARGYFERAVELNPHSADSHLQLGNIYLAETQYARAAEAYEKAGELGIDSAAYHFRLATVYYNLRNYLGPIRRIEVIGGEVGQITPHPLLLIDPVPGHKDTFLAVGPRSAIFCAARAAEMGIDMPELTLLKANTWLNARRFEKADALYRELEAVVQADDEGLMWYYWAQAALGLDDLDAYLERLEKAIALEPEVYEPTRADAYVTVANRHHQRGEQDKYLEYLGKAVETNPLSVSLQLTYGDALYQAGRTREAIRTYHLVLELDAEHPRRVELLNRIRRHEAARGG